MKISGDMRKQIVKDALDEIEAKALEDFREMMKESEDEGTGFSELINPTSFWEFEEHMSFNWRIIKNCRKGRDAFKYYSLKDIEIKELD